MQKCLQAAYRCGMQVCLRASKLPNAELITCQQYTEPLTAEEMVSHFVKEAIPGAMFPCSLSGHLSKHNVKIHTVVWGFFFCLVSFMSLILAFLLSYIPRTSARKGLCLTTFHSLADSQYACISWL